LVQAEDDGPQLARLPITGSNVFGREEDIAFLNDAWANQQVNVVTIVAWVGLHQTFCRVGG
jgi:hypothetical protein